MTETRRCSQPYSSRGSVSLSPLLLWSTIGGGPPWCRGGHLLRQASVIVALHVATGAAAGAASGSRLAALVLGPALHLLGDRVPHRDFHSTRFEIGTGVAGIALLAARRGPLDPATLGALASSAPDLEHVLPFLRPGGRKLFHDRLGWHREGPFQPMRSSCSLA